MENDEDIVEYEYDGEHLDTEEIELKLDDDETTYITSNDAEKYEDAVKQEENSCLQRFRWTPTYVKLLIKGYFERRHKFNDPKCKKRDIWYEIYKEFRSYGLLVNEDSLNKKWRNLKKTYKSIKEKIDREGPGRGVRWEHYEVFELIYAQNNSKIDPTFLEEYFSNLEYFEENGLVQVSGKEASPERFIWCSKSVDFLLNSYYKRKDQFRDPRVMKKKLWSEIWQEMMLDGYDIESEEILDRKMRNMKKTYKDLRKNKGNGPISWAYYFRLDEIFSDDPGISNFDVFNSEFDTQEAWSVNSADEEKYDVSSIPEAFESTTNSPIHTPQEYYNDVNPLENKSAIQNEIQISKQTQKLYDWCPKSIKFFLKSYIKRKKQFRDPKEDKNKLWQEILVEMNSSGFPVENINILVTKMHSMTKTYKTIRKKNQNRGTDISGKFSLIEFSTELGQGQIRWEYLGAFEKLYSNNSIKHTTATIRSESSYQDRSSPLSTPEESQQEEHSSQSTELNSIDQRQWLLEERRAKMTEKVYEALQKTNELLQERNDLLRQLVRCRKKKK